MTSLKGILSHTAEGSLQQVIFDKQPGINNPCGLAYDRKDHMYIATNTTPATIQKVNIHTMQHVGSITLPAGQGRNQTRVSAMFAMDEDTIIHGSYENPFVLTRINSKMEITGTLIGIEEAVNDKYARPMVSDGRYLYIGCDTPPGKIVKIDPFNMTRIGSRTLDSGFNNIYGMTYLNGFLYAGTETSPARIVKINASNMNQVATLTLNTGFNNAYSVITDGRNLFVGCNMSPYKIAKVDPETMTQVASSYTAPSGENEIWGSLVYNGEHVIAGSWTDPAIITKLKPADLTLVDKITVANGFYSKMMYVEPYLFSPNDMSPGRFTKMLIPIQGG